MTTRTPFEQRRAALAPKGARAAWVKLIGCAREAAVQSAPSALELATLLGFARATN